MDNRTIMIICLVVIAVLAILCPVIINAVRDHDYKMQLKGKRPMRSINDNKRGSYYVKAGDKKDQTDIHHDESRLKRMQNLFGPK